LREAKLANWISGYIGGKVGRVAVRVAVAGWEARRREERWKRTLLAFEACKIQTARAV